MTPADPRRRSRRVNTVIVLASLIVAAVVYAKGAPVGRYVGAAWFDQSQYLMAARAWATWDLDPRHHWYLPGYPLLGALGATITPAQPFWLPDLLCLLASLWLCSRLAARLAPGWRYAPALGAAVFLATTVMAPRVLQVWVVPWTTTPAVPLTLAAILLALRFQHAATARTAGLAAAATTAIALFRPSDALIVLLTVPAFMGWWLVAQRPGLGRAAGILIVSVVGAALPLAVLAAVHGAVYGWSAGPYLTYSAALGFEWRLVPWRWVVLFLGPQPAYATHLAGGGPGGVGMIVMFPWIAPGLAGLSACVALDRPRRAAHLLITAVVTLHILAYLAYRDLQPEALWRFENYHYFKMVLPLFGLYGVLFLGRLLQPGRWRSVGVALPVLVGLLCWRGGWVPAAPTGARVEDVGSLELPRGLPPIGGGLAVAALGSWDSIYFGATALTARVGTTSVQNVGFKTVPVPGGFIVEALRPLPSLPSVLHLDPGIRLDAAVPPVSLRHSIRFRLPCVAPAWLPGCAVPAWLPGPALAVGTTLALDQAADPYLLDGWSVPTPDGRHIEGTSAQLVLRPVGLTAGGLIVTLEASADLPNGGPIGVILSVGAADVGTWTLASADHTVLRALIPSHLLDTTGSLVLRLTLKRPPPTADRRRASLFVRSLRLDPA